MAAESLQLAINLGLFANVVKPATHTPGEQVSRTIEFLGSDITFDEVYEYDSTLGTPGVTTPNAVAVLRRIFAIPASPFTYELDLESAPIESAMSGGAPALSEDLNGKKLLAFMLNTIRTDGTTNTSDITVKPDAAAGYDLFGASMADGEVMKPDSVLAKVYHNDDAPAIVNSGGGSPAHLIEFVGATEGDEIEVIMAFSSGS
jgi:hypothetical protein